VNCVGGSLAQLNAVATDLKAKGEQIDQGDVIALNITITSAAATLRADSEGSLADALTGVWIGSAGGGKGAKGVGDPSQKALGLGSTGRTAPANLREQLAMKQAMASPASGRPLPIVLTDSRWPATDGWRKMSQNINGIEIHYVQNLSTGAVDDFKFN